MSIVHRRPSNENLRFQNSVHPVIQKIFKRRPISDVNEIELGLNNLLTPEKFKGIDDAVSLLINALKKQERVLIVADFDADGATSCVVAIDCLRKFGLKQIDYVVPNRFEYGYGLTPEIVELGKLKKPDLIITVDNGISSLDGVATANAAGISVIITDHHIAPNILPAAHAILNPNQPGCEFPSKCIAGVGVIFYLMLALRSRLRSLDWFLKLGLNEPNLADQLDLVAIGTIADVVPLDRNNRILVDEGLRRIRNGKTRPGIDALISVSNREGGRLKASDVGFGLAPRLNAAGRLEDMSTGIECLLSTSDSDAYQLALALDGINRDRKKIELDMREQAWQALDEIAGQDKELPNALCLFDERWHQGIVGIIASRVKDKYHRPAIAFAQVDESQEIKGSARSIKGFHIRDALDIVATKNPGLIDKFGGHAMAAGLSLKRQDFEVFEKAFLAEASRLLDEEQLQSKVLSDGNLEPKWLTLEVASLIEAAGPWGQEFSEPLFDDTFRLVEHRKVGKNHLKMVLSPMDYPSCALDAIAFNVETSDWPKEGSKEIEIAYRLETNHFQGNTSLQLMVEHILNIL
tara:strand:- start:549 stop:2282 length:1734 start_codon:yes stop_codon:yes gene_type:complete